jgi:N-methylhydantoinase A
MSYRIGVDIGGTFTDVVAVAQDGRVIEAKVPSQHDHPEDALVAALEEIAQATASDGLQQLLQQTTIVVQGTTVAINAVLQKTGARTGLLCTRGFRDALAIRLGYKEERYVFPYAPPPELVSRELRLPVTERVDKDGRVRIALAEAEVEAAASSFAAAGVEAIAVCFLWSVANREHERRAQEILCRALPGVFVTKSSDVLPRVREYNRTSTTVLNAYVGPVVRRYVERTETRLRQLGFRGRIRYMQSNGGLAEAAEVKERPVLLLVSGPAAAPAAGLRYERLAGQNFITVDAGGTSFDACLVHGGRPATRSVADIEGYRIATPLIDVNTLGSGGGSIASVDDGLLRVGPESAEANPGPACYRRGGDRPTLTDAHVVTGLLNPTDLLGGRFKIDRQLAVEAIDQAIARPLGLDVDRAAAGITEIVNRKMADAIREITIRRGHDPRDYALVVGGGAGGLHAARLAAELGITRLVIPRIASELCAFGAAVADIRHDYTRSHVGDADRADFGAVSAVFAELENTARNALTDEGVEDDAISFQRSLDLRYRDQVWEVPVDITDLDLDTQTAAKEVQQRFHEMHEKLYQYSQPDYPCELISITLTALAATTELAVRPNTATSHGAPAPSAFRPVQFDPTTPAEPTPVFAGSSFRHAVTVDGPAIVEEPNTTIVIPPGWRADFDPDEQAYCLTGQSRDA